MSLPRTITCSHCGAPPNFGPDMRLQGEIVNPHVLMNEPTEHQSLLQTLGSEGAKVIMLEAAMERIRIAFQALRDGAEHANNKLYRALMAEFQNPDRAPQRRCECLTYCVEKCKLAPDQYCRKDREAAGLAQEGE